ncbi:MAG: MraY family glycosyltransferase [Candidatus Omnitrophota bacterium]
MPSEYWIILFLSAAASFAATPWLRRMALRLDITDRPSARKIHARPMPYLGGLAFHIAMTAALGYVFLFAPYMLGVGELRERLLILYSVAALFLLLGVVDDIKPIPASLKLLVQIALSFLLVSSGFGVAQMTSPFGGSLVLGWLGYILSLFWILTIVNAINFIDGLDGLAGGIVFFAALANLLIALHPWQNFVCIISLILMGAVLGFLPYNFSPAKIFMGDAGSLYLGVLLAGSALESNVKSATMSSLSLPVVILSVPLLDAFLTVIRRGRKGRRFFTADREHLHHRLIRLGFSDRQAVLSVYGLCFLLSMSAVFAAQLPNRYSILFLFVFLAAAGWGLAVFNAFERRMIGGEREEE